MFMKILTPFFILLLSTGCGRIETDVEDGTTFDSDLPPAANCVGTQENAYGCYGRVSTSKAMSKISIIPFFMTAINVGMISEKTVRYLQGSTLLISVYRTNGASMPMVRP